MLRESTFEFLDRLIDPGGIHDVETKRSCWRVLGATNEGKTKGGDFRINIGEVKSARVGEPLPPSPIPQRGARQSLITQEVS